MQYRMVIPVTILAVLLLVMGGVSVAEGYNDLLVNGDFDNGLNGWIINVTVNVNYSWLSGFEGRNGVLFIESNSSFGSRFDFYQIISVDGNVSGVYSIDVYSNSSCIDCYIDVLIYNPNISQYYLVDRINVGNFSGWRSFEKYINVPNGSWEFYILVNSYEAGLNIAIDAVHLLIDNNNAIGIMGGKANTMESYYFMLTYTPLVFLVLSTLYYFIKRKLLVRKLAKYGR